MSVLLIVVVVIKVAVAYLVIAASMGSDVLVIRYVVAAKAIGVTAARVVLTSSHHSPLISILRAAFAAPPP
jgi:hypothetical protein